MPREVKKRGRREEKKRKAQEFGDEEPLKRQRTDNEDHQGVELDNAVTAGDDYVAFDGIDGEGEQLWFEDSNPSAPVQENQFYGLLEEEEQKYYANVNAKLNANDFEDAEDRTLFIQAVHRETQGKELKVASSQSCSRYLEKVIFLSTSDQLKSLFKAFLENITYLVQHRFGSHCCEALFLQAAKYVQPEESADEGEDTMEALFLQAVRELSSNLGYLVTDRFATHAVRVLLLVLSGEAVDESSSRMIASRKKEKLDMPEPLQPEQDTKRKVPRSFRTALRNMIAVAVSSLDTTYIRALATHPTGNPFLQLVLKLELSSHDKSKDNHQQTLFQKLFPDEELDPESETGRFIQGLIYDPTGSHLVEILVQYLPGKVFKKLYGNILKERMKNLAKNDIASYIAIKVLERLGKDDLADARDRILPEVQGLVARSRVGLIKVLFERFAVRQVDSKPLVEELKTAYGDDSVAVFPKMLQLDFDIENTVAHASRNGDAQIAPPIRADLHGSLLAQAMLNTPVACELIQESLLSQPVSTTVLMAKSPIVSRAIQAALASELSGEKFRRQYIPKFYGHVAELAQDAAGSHVIDALWTATKHSHFLKEKLAREMLQSESMLRESRYGRTVWRNWSMDLFQRRPRDWQAIAKGYTREEEQQPDAGPKKSAIQLARERHMKAKGSRKPDAESVQSTNP